MRRVLSYDRVAGELFGGGVENLSLWAVRRRTAQSLFAEPHSSEPQCQQSLNGLPVLIFLSTICQSSRYHNESINSAEPLVLVRICSFVFLVEL